MGEKGSAMIRFARLAVEVAGVSLPEYAHRFAPKKYRLSQLAACVLLRVYLRQDWRGIEGILMVSAPLREAIGLKQVPDHTTLNRFARRFMTPESIKRMLAQVLRVVGLKSDGVGVDSTGFDTHVQSSYFRTRSGKARRRYVKLSLAVSLSPLLVVGVASGWGPSNDKDHFLEMMEPVHEKLKIHTLLGDAGYDAEWIHRWCRDERQIESLIPPAVHRKDGAAGGLWRSKMVEGLPPKYHLRWRVESVISAIKRRFGSQLTSRHPHALFSEILLYALAYSIHR
jgi:hypothetical protein